MVARSAELGFTLIEMSIVLAIIGLIIGGILKGQEVVNNARLKTQVAQIDAVKGAIFTFQDQYSFLPGDYPNATATLGFTSDAGDGNGAVAAPSATSMLDTDSEASTESVLAWAQLDASNLLAGIQLPSGTPVSSIVEGSTGVTMPGKMNNTYLWFATFSSTPKGATAAIIAPMIRIQPFSSGAIPAQTQPYAVREPDAANIDRKYDDGIPGSGSIITNSASDTTNCNAGGHAYVITAGASPQTPYCDLLWVAQ
jgi:prepilin-type N-terminal cleavage/methylation domain-containing protein